MRVVGNGQEPAHVDPRQSPVDDQGVRLGGTGQRCGVVHRTVHDRRFGQARQAVGPVAGGRPDFAARAGDVAPDRRVRSVDHQLDLTGAVRDNRRTAHVDQIGVGAVRRRSQTDVVDREAVNIQHGIQAAVVEQVVCIGYHDAGRIQTHGPVVAQIEVSADGNFVAVAVPGDLGAGAQNQVAGDVKLPRQCAVERNLLPHGHVAGDAGRCAAGSDLVDNRRDAKVHGGSIGQVDRTVHGHSAAGRPPAVLRRVRGVDTIAIDCHAEVGAAAVLILGDCDRVRFPSIQMDDLGGLTRIVPGHRRKVANDVIGAGVELTVQARVDPKDLEVV